MKIRPAAVAGYFYPANAKELKNLINKFFEKEEEVFEPPKKIKALIVPHAGYIYSGPVAAQAYKILKNNKQNPQKIILIGPSHHFALNYFVFSESDEWATPLGNVKVLKPQKAEEFFEPAFEPEHSLEVQLPFLQTILSKFEIMPILINEDKVALKLADFLKETIDEKTLIIVSSDLSHYYPLEIANQIDNQTIKIIENKDIGKKNLIDACGRAGILSLLYLANNLNWKVNLIKYQTSYETTNDDLNVVGYASFVFY
jgi:AmmeMemoRadiSam system protein B